MSDSKEKVIKYILACREEAKSAKQSRMEQNKQNFDAYHMRYDFSHKKPGQSREVLSKQTMAVEQTASFFQQALVDMGDWFRIESKDTKSGKVSLIKEEEMQKLMVRQMEHANYFSFIGNSIKSALLGALLIAKTSGELCPSPRFVVKRDRSKRKKLIKIEDKYWKLKKDVLSQVNWYPDPTGAKLYDIEEMFLDLSAVKQLAEGENAIYSKEEVELLSTSFSSSENDETRRNETNQDTPTSGHRPTVKLTEFWGTIVDDQGNIEQENILATIANDRFLIRAPEENPLWHQGTPFITAALMEFPNTVWPRALMDAGTQHERAITEIYNLTLDSVMKKVHAVTQIRTSWLQNPAQVSNGIPPGTNLQVTDSCPPGAKVMEPVSTVEVPQEAFQMMNLVQQEHNSSVLSSDIRNGVTPFRESSATAIVETNQTITSVFKGIAKNIESRFIQKDLELTWKEIAQHWDEIDPEEFVSLFGPERGRELASLDPKDVFASTVSGTKFKVFGISLTMNKAIDFRKWTTLLQTVAGSEILTDAFVKENDFMKLMNEIMTSLDIDKSKIKRDEEPMPMAPSPQEQLTQQGPDNMSQVPQAGAGTLADMMGTPSFPSMSFPGSPATKAGA